MPLGHYTSLSATTAGTGAALWYKSDGTWTTTYADRYIFPQAQIAQHTAIKSLPAGYHTQVVFEDVQLPPRPTSTPSTGFC